MTSADDLVGRLADALDQTEEIISRITPDQRRLPTPCSSWDVEALVEHVVQDIRMFTARSIGAAWEPGHDGVAIDDWSGAYQRAADDLLAVWRTDGALERTVKLPFGEVPASWQVGQQISDVVVHGWDLAKATGQSTELDPELGELSLAWARENLKPEFRGDERSGQVFGPEVAAPDDAPLYERLAAFFGRTVDQP